MPFPVEEKYIVEAENELKVKFPISFRNKMKDSNGGEIEIEDDVWNLFPFFFDKSDKKRISRTCNDIIKETKISKEWNGFPDNAVAIGENGCGDKLVFILKTENTQELDKTIYVWQHENNKLIKVADTFNKLI